MKKETKINIGITILGVLLLMLGIKVDSGMIMLIGILSVLIFPMQWFTEYTSDMGDVNES